jgi:hypothetical protein
MEYPSTKIQVISQLSAQVIFFSEIFLIKKITKKLEKIGFSYVNCIKFSIFVGIFCQIFDITNLGKQGKKKNPFVARDLKK